MGRPIVVLSMLLFSLSVTYSTLAALGLGLEILYHLAISTSVSTSVNIYTSS